MWEWGRIKHVDGYRNNLPFGVRFAYRVMLWQSFPVSFCQKVILSVKSFETSSWSCCMTWSLQFLFPRTVANHIFILSFMQVSYLIPQLMQAPKKECILLHWSSAVRCISDKCMFLCRQALERYSREESSVLSVSQQYI